MKTLAFILFLAFIHPISPEIHASYGTGSLESETGYNLVLLENGEFKFADFSQQPAVKAEGNWIAEGNKILLSPKNPNAKIPTQWKKEKELHCIKARKGMGFYRICSTEK